jgi:hypothetical protein
MKRRVSSKVVSGSGGQDFVEDGGTNHSVVDGRFNILPQARSKVSVDDRFSAMLTDPSFGSLEVRDKYGRKGKRRVSDNVAELYELKKSDVDSSDEKDLKKKPSRKDLDDLNSMAKKASDREGLHQGAKRGDSSSSALKQIEHRQASASDANLDDSVMSKLKTRDIRSAMNDWTSGSSSSSSSSVSGGSSDDDSDADGFGGVGGIAASATSTIPEGEETRRLAVLHLDWDRISAKDIFAMLHSFLPPSRGLLSVTVYPSEFGKEQMATERTSGPVVKLQPKSNKEQNKKSLISSKSSGADAEADFDDDTLRAYELNKLRYYYAVAEFDSAETASAVYEQCDGVEFEASSNVLDLRFIPDTTTFDGDDVRDSATSMPTTYVAPIFTTSALQMSKVQLTWDDDDPKRSVLKGDKHGRINYADFLASGSSSDDNVGQGGNSSDDDTSRIRPEKRMAYASLLDSLHSQGDHEGESSAIEMKFDDNVQRRADSVLAAFSGDPTGINNSKKNKKKGNAEEDSLYVDDIEVSLRLIEFTLFSAHPISIAPIFYFELHTELQWDPNDPYHAEELEKVAFAFMLKFVNEQLMFLF